MTTLITSLLLSAGAHGAPFAVEASSCDLSAAGVTAPEGMDRVPSGQLAILDGAAATVGLFGDDCTRSGGFSTAAFGATQPTGLAYDSTDDRYAISDDFIGALYFADTAGVLQGSCTLWQQFATPTAIAYDPVVDAFVVFDDTSDVLYTIDDSEVGGGPCNILAPLPLGSLTNSGHDIAYVPHVDGFAVDGGGAVQVVDRGGAGVESFTIPGGSTGALAYEEEGYYRVARPAPSTLDLIDVRGTLTEVCLHDADITAIAYNGVDNQIIVREPGGTGKARILRPSDCSRVRTIQDVGSNIGMAYIPATNELAVASNNFSIRFFDYATGAEVGSCDTLDWSLSPRGVAWIEGHELLAVSSDDGLVMVERDCTVRYARRFIDPPPSPKALEFHTPTGQFLVFGTGGLDELQAVSFEGLTQSKVGPIPGPGNWTGFTRLPSLPHSFLLAESDGHIYRLDLPAMSETTSLSGKFVSASATAYLLERGEGRMTGRLELNGDIVPVFGQVGANAGSLVFGAVTPSGKPVAVDVAVGPDRNTIEMPGPIGTLVRSP